MTPGSANRFWQRVDKRGPNDCWKWTGSTANNGLPTFFDGTKNLLARRVAYNLAHPNDPARKRKIVASCGNKLCVNPMHAALQGGDAITAAAGNSDHSDFHQFTVVAGVFIRTRQLHVEPVLDEELRLIGETRFGLSDELIHSAFETAKAFLRKIGVIEKYRPQTIAA